MRLRTVGLVLALAALIFPLAGEAQQAKKKYRVGLFHVGLDHVPPSLKALRERLSQLGYEEGRNIVLDWRNLPDEEAAREVAKEFVRERVDLIVAFENQTVRAAKAATAEIPIIMLHATDPVREGFVKSLARPGGNVTGFAGLLDVPGKRLELLKEAVPGLDRVLLLVDPKDPSSSRQLVEVHGAGRLLGLEFLEREASTEGDIKRIFGSVRAGDADGVFVVSPNLYLKFSTLIIRLALEKRLPLGWHRRFGADQGALFSYGPLLAPIGHDAAEYIARILRGAHPENLPVQGLQHLELVINLKTAKALGLTIPPSLLLRADQIIE